MKTCRPWRPWNVKCTCTTKSCCMTRCRCTKRIESRLKKVLPSCGLTRLAALFLSFKLDNEKAHKLTKMDHKPKSWELNCDPLWGIHGRIGEFTSLRSTSHSLSQKLQYWFNFTLIYVTAWAAWAQHALVYICLKIMLLDSSAKERKLPL